MGLDLPPPVPAIEFTLASHGMSKGAGQTDGAQAVGRAALRFGSVQSGVQWKNVNSSSAKGEASAFLSGSHKFGSFQLNAGVAYKILTAAPKGTDRGSWEFTAGATRKFGQVSLRTNAIFSPDDTGSARRSLFVEAGPAVQLSGGWTASAALGHRSRQNGLDYTAWNAGVAWQAHGLQLDVRYYGTNRSGIDDPYHDRLVALARVSF